MEEELIEIKQKDNLNNLVALIVVVALTFLITGVLLGTSFASNNNNTGIVTDNNNNTGISNLSGEDRNWFTGLSYTSGFCARQGLLESVMVQKTDSNELYGIPICIENPKNIESE